MVVIKSYANAAKGAFNTSRKGTRMNEAKNAAATLAAADSNTWVRARLQTPSDQHIYTRVGHYLEVKEEAGYYLRDTYPCINMDTVFRYANILEPGIKIEYIPMHERWGCWFEGNTLHREGKASVKWVGEGPRPDNVWQMQQTKLYLVRGCIGDTVAGVIKRSRGQMPDVEWRADGTWWAEIGKVREWVKEAVDEWKAQVPQQYHGTVRELRWPTVYNLILEKKFSKNDFHQWLDQRAWDQADNEINDNQKDLNEEVNRVLTGATAGLVVKEEGELEWPTPGW